MKVRKFIASVWLDAISLIIISIVFVVPFIFIVLTAANFDYQFLIEANKIDNVLSKRLLSTEFNSI